MYKHIDLSEIQKMQFSDKNRAERELLAFLQRHEDSSIESIELTPKPQSLNSINGFATYNNGERYFFKTHTEENEQISEYYNDSVLAKAGYPVIKAKQVSHRPGKQIALYEIVSLPTLFDLVKIEEDRELVGETHSKQADILIAAQKELDKTTANIYQSTLQKNSAQEQASAAVNQLFINRLAEDGRVGLFYRDKHFYLHGKTLPFETLANLSWIINGVEYNETIEQLIQQSKSVLSPQAGPVVIGHGDAHNGNIFVDLEGRKFMMFDPAFAGSHHPLLDITKPLAHNVFFRWMYYPEQVANEIQLSYKIVEDRIIIEHSFKPSQLRLELLRSKKDNVLGPLLNLLKKRQLLSNDWRDYLRASLFCCPFLTVNLLAQEKRDGTLAERYSLPIKLLGLAFAIEMGSRKRVGKSHISDLIGTIFD